MADLNAKLLADLNWYIGEAFRVAVMAAAGEVTAIKAVTDALPNAGALTDIDAATVAIQAVTDLLPDAGALSDLATIEAVTSALPDAGALTSISAETDKIDSAVTSGLAGTSNSLAYRVHEIEKHVHNRARRWGATAAPDETNAIEANVNRPFVAISGNNAWGAAIPIIGTADAPVPAPDNARFDLHHLMIVDVDDTTVYRIRIIYGTGTSADAIAAGQWTEFMFMAGTGPKTTGAAMEVMMPRVAVGAKCWASVWNASNLSEVDFFIGVHGYAG